MVYLARAIGSSWHCLLVLGWVRRLPALLATSGNRKYLFVPKTTKQRIQHKNHTIYYIYVDMIKQSGKNIEYGLKIKDNVIRDGRLLLRLKNNRCRRSHPVGNGGLMVRAPACRSRGRWFDSTSAVSKLGQFRSPHFARVFRKGH